MVISYPDKLLLCLYSFVHVTVANLDLELGPKRIGCFARTLQLCVKDGLVRVPFSPEF